MLLPDSDDNEWQSKQDEYELLRGRSSALAHCVHLLETLLLQQPDDQVVDDKSNRSPEVIKKTIPVLLAAMIDELRPPVSLATEESRKRCQRLARIGNPTQPLEDDSSGNRSVDDWPESSPATRRDFLVFYMLVKVQCAEVQAKLYRRPLEMDDLQRLTRLAHTLLGDTSIQADTIHELRENIWRLWLR